MKRKQLYLEKNCNSYELSEAQKRIYMITSLDAKNKTWSEVMYKRFSGKYNRCIFRENVEKLLFIQPQLGVTLMKQENTILQIIHNDIDIDNMIEEIDLSDLEADAQEAEAIRIITECKNYIFELENSILYKIKVIKMGEEDHIIVQMAHHFIYDSWSIDLFWKTLKDCFNHVFVKRNEYHLYGQYEREILKTSKQYLEAKNYWKKELAVEVPQIQYSHTQNSAHRIYKHGIHEAYLSSDFVNRLKNFAARNNTIMSSAYLSALFILIYKYWNAYDICIGKMFSGRKKRDYKNTIGYFVNILPIRVLFQKEDTFMDILKEVTTKVLDAYQNQEVSLEEILEQVKPKHIEGRHPLFQILFNMTRQRNKQDQVYQLDTMKEIPYKVNLHKNEETPYSVYEMALFIYEMVDSTYFAISYNQTVFSESQIERMYECFLNILNMILEHYDESISKANFLSASDKEKLLKDFNKVELAAINDDETVVEKIKKQLLSNPEKIILTYKSNNLTCKVLNEKSDILAKYIQEHYYLKTNYIGLILGNSFELIISILAILKLGCAYVPIDHKTPADRIKYIIETSKADCILTNKEYSYLVNEQHKIVDIDEICWDSLVKYEMRTTINKNNFLYAIYTSGTTGKPKEIKISNYNLLRLFLQYEKVFEFRKDDVWIMCHSCAFDFSVWEIFGALLYGCRLVIPEREIVYYPDRLYDLIVSEKVTILNQTPYSFINIMHTAVKDSRDHALRYVILSAEKFNAYMIKEWVDAYGFDRTKIVNCYGITEVTVMLTYHFVNRFDVYESDESNVGYTLGDIKTYVMDENQHVVPIGAVGELCISGAGLAAGYKNDDKIIPSPFDTQYPFDKIYKTGDMVYYSEAGELIYCDRKDNMVNLRGYRIELSEIRTVLLETGMVNDACIRLEHYGINDDRIIAYLLLDNINADFNRIKAYLKKKLPHYMMPSMFFEIGSIPLTINGKVDFKKIAILKKLETNHNPAKESYSNIEQIIKNLWMKYLHCEDIRKNDDFFDIGGNSFLILKVYYELKYIYEIQLGISDCYEYATIESLARYISEIKDC